MARFKELGSRSDNRIVMMSYPTFFAKLLCFFFSLPSIIPSRHTFNKYLLLSLKGPHVTMKFQCLAFDFKETMGVKPVVSKKKFV